MSRVELEIYYKDGSVTKQRAVVNKWKFLDSMMGEQYIMFNITSETPIAWAIGDYCVFRGETFTLNYVPSVTQKARIKERQDSFTYENVKFESQQEELTRCTMLDITPTTGDYIAALGTNYTGSSRFNLFCGETTANGSTLTAVCALAAKMQANLDRMFPTNGWKILVDTKTTYIDGSGNPVLVTHTDDKMLSFDNTNVAQALAEVHNTFDLDYCVRGRTIYIGYSLKNLTSDNDDETFAFGYGKGYPTRDDSGKALFQIKRIANSQQKVVTRLRALGSTKNMPYRYYNSKYNLSQSLFPTNLQLPDTFIPEGSKSDAAGTNSKWGHNKQRASYLRAVKGDTNDAYIDKNDDAASCVEGIREESARWDGTNGDLPEIYPTIEEATYGELRSALVQDQDGRTGQDSFPNYGSTERIDSMLAIGYLSDGTLVDDANKGDGILPKNGTTGSGIPRSATIGQTTLNYNTRNNGDFTNRGSFYAGVERTLFTIQDVFAGKYAMAPTFGAVIYGFSLSSYKDGISAEVGFQIAIKQKSKNTGTTTTIATYTSDFISIARADGIKEMALPEIPDVKDGSGAKVSSVTVTELSDITVTFTPIMRNITVPSDFTDNFGLVYKVGNSRLDNTVTYAPEYTWISVDEEGNSEETFHVFIKDMGFDITACWTDDTPVVAMKSGRCVGREFEIGENVQKVTYNGKQGYMLTLKRATDSSLNTYYPSANDPIAAGDYFVLLNISMPDVYVKMAEVRLLKAATDYLADNCETAFTYQPYIDDIFLQRNYDNMEAAGTPENSIFWRLYAGLKFTFRGIPTNEEDPLPLADITIAQVSISMGEGLTPKVEITLNDDVQQSTLQKLTTSVDRIYNGSLFSSGSGGAAGTGANSAALMSILQSEGAKRFLSKKKDDTAQGFVGFVKGLWVKTKGLFGFSEQGDVTARSLKATGSSGGTTPDADNVTQKNLGLEVSESGVIGGILRVAQSLLTKTIQSLNFSGSDSLTGTGWQLTDDDGNGRSRLIVDDAVFRGKVSLNQLEVRKLTAMGGNYVFSPAAGIIEEVDYYGYKIVPGEVEPAVELLGYEYIKVPWVLRLIPLSLRGRYLSRKKWVRSTMSAEDYARVKFYRCWLKADDGSTQTINTWQVGMLARCQTFDTSQIENGNHAGSYDKPQDSGGTYSNVTNKLYWRAVVATGQGIDKNNYAGQTVVLDDGRKHNYIDLANYLDNGVQLFLTGSDHVSAGDHIVCFGDWKDRQLANLVTIETIGRDAPAVKEFVGVGYTDGTPIDWSLDGKELTRISPISGNKFVAPEFKVVINGQTHDLANFMVNTDGVLTKVQDGMTGMVSVVQQTAGGYAVYLRKLGTEESDILAGFTLDSNGNIDITGSKITLGTGSTASQQAVFEGGKLRLALLDVVQIVAGGISAQTIDCQNATFNNVNVSGKVTATSGAIAGFKIEGGRLTGSSDSMSNYSLELGATMMEFKKTDNLTGYTVTTTLDSDGLTIWDGKHRFKTFEAAGANSVLTAAGYPDMYNTRLPLTLANTDTNSGKTNVALRLSAHSGGKNVAAMIDNGQVMGLRPEVRGVNRDTALTLYDHTIIATKGCTLTLPSSPQEGQQYHIVCMTTGTVKLKSVAQSAEQSAAQINWKYLFSSLQPGEWRLGKGTEYDLTASVREAWLTFTGTEWHLTNN